MHMQRTDLSYRWISWLASLSPALFRGHLYFKTLFSWVLGGQGKFSLEVKELIKISLRSERGQTVPIGGH